MDNNEAARLLDTYDSFVRAVDEAGGSLHAKFLDMTVREFILKVAAPNQIRFEYMGHDYKAPGEK